MAGWRLGSWWRWGRMGLAGVVACVGFAAPTGLAIAASAAGTRADVALGRSQDPWLAALAARRSFEAEPAEEHTRAEFARVMDAFRAIYHGDPADLHAPQAVNQVAELLAEQGRVLQDPKSLRAAAAQYEFLAKAYPASSLAAPGLGQAVELLGSAGVNDPAEAARVRLVLRQTYPGSAAARGVRAPARSEALDRAPAVPATGATGRAPAAQPATDTGPETADGQAKGTDGASAGSSHYEKPSRGRRPAAVVPIPVENARPTNEPREAGSEAAPAVVSGIRHWSTASYTRVAIDLGDEVQFQAARVENPDRIFFDLHGAKLAAGLAGKSFAITDDGFLKTIRAAQSGPDVTRIILDVQPVAEYSAFLLPNPYRLIIDIHGRQPQGGATEAAAPNLTTRQAESAAAEAPAPSAAVPAEQPPAPVTRTAPSAAAAGGSTLPPMPVTDGSASFGLPPKRREPVTGTTGAVAPPRVVVSVKPTTAKPVPNSVSTLVPGNNRDVAAVSEGPGVITAKTQPTTGPVVDRTATPVRKPSGGSAPLQPAVPQPAPPTADGQSTLMRALGLKIGRIVIDAGHGGHDSGTLGPDGLEEKDVVLDVALRLGKLLHDRLGAEVVYTRADDTFIPLETRTAIANKAQADLFISVHANSSPDEDARGVEVYYLNFTSDPEAMQVASRENAISSQRVNQLSDLVKKIALKDKIDESRELAADVDQSLYAGLRKGNAGLKDRGVKKAPFVVLIGANMPSILAEISFVTNPEDAAKLSEPEYRERVAESLYGGIARYAAAVNGARPRRTAAEQAQR